MRNLTGSLLAAGLLLAGSATSQAQDTVRLGGPSAQADIDGGADTAFVHWRRGGYYGGYRGYYGGYAYYRPYYAGYGYYRPYYRGYYGYGYGYYAPPVYYYQPYIYYSSPSYYYPIAGSTAPIVQTKSSYSEQLPAPKGVPPMPPANNGTFQYDGGPRELTPMPGPGEEFSPAKQLRSIVPIDGKLATLPSEVSMGSYLLTSFAAPKTTKSAPPRSGYAAYGEDPFTAPARKR